MHFERFFIVFIVEDCEETRGRSEVESGKIWDGAGGKWRERTQLIKYSMAPRRTLFFFPPDIACCPHTLPLLLGLGGDWEVGGWLPTGPLTPPVPPQPCPLPVCGEGTTHTVLG